MTNWFLPVQNASEKDMKIADNIPMFYSITQTTEPALESDTLLFVHGSRTIKPLYARIFINIKDNLSFSQVINIYLTQNKKRGENAS